MASFIESSFKCYKNQNWVDNLPLVLMGYRSSVIQDIGYSPSEMLYGTNLRLPGDFFESYEEARTNNDWVKQFCENMQMLKASPTAHHGANSSFIPSTLKNCTHVFIRHDAVRKPLQRPYDGPFKVISRNDKIFKLLVSGKEKVVSIDRLKPAFIFTEDTREEPNIEPKQIPQKNNDGIKLRSGRRVTFALP
ncbi:uncharacterized protein LOC119612551 [Lucilia sericata]|uniref:uncharacterized protein LOC119612551 n=1 Tax=Lucilia sericata TaxID=13632 RepID=UPI0018A82AAA|nr:uncharacterized protein LOC119612551 [Lucilia sericata]